jgi:hypothetical protein
LTSSDSSNLLTEGLLLICLALEFANSIRVAERTRYSHVSDHVKVNKSEQMPTLPFSKFGLSCRLQSDCFFIRKINRMLAANERDKGKNGPLTLASERERRVP